MLASLVEGYSSEEEEEEEEAKGKEEKAGKGKDTKENAAEGKDKEGAEGSGAKKRKLPSASQMMASTSSWARDDDEQTEEKSVDRIGKEYHNVPPPTGVRASDTIGERADYIKPAVGTSVDANKVYTGQRMLANSSLVPPQLKGRKNVNTEDVGSWTTEKRYKSKTSE
ncbi:hypothetical protein GUITHDRAFT_106640 [Guillardia theta CCMP2712]|uniref:Uncharacterized protein n=1 Tax=Guillardia theta (strain CCMP2712) TaxID=905079 RepID=L1JH37_GUITC|nr:hypothetical protein GUITHDRAFT_106640 [Guillardia theta CCMP2712]EKX47652.1 hypothetical protein GUITHDRAFT_106640 [Guillardia theta CCMP2712]|eukprot:XP_005834632.1 hypothetical protein GUITHDRAFT_106640 [Guillardia theta CCMP2712]